MAACEKCWRDAGGDPETYTKLLAKRADKVCSPEEQAGDGAEVCPACERRALHQYANVCMACDWDGGADVI